MCKKYKMSSDLLTSLVQTQINEELKDIAIQRMHNYMDVLNTWINDINKCPIKINKKINLTYKSYDLTSITLINLKHVLTNYFRRPIKDLIRNEKKVYNGTDDDYGSTIYTCYIVFGESLDDEISKTKLRLQELEALK
jgi:hypothetical protein